MKMLGVLLVLSAFAPFARASDGELAKYSQGHGYVLQTICEHITDAGDETSCEIEVVDKPIQDCHVTYGTVQSACTPPNPITLTMSDVGCTAPAVQTAIGTLTDPASGTSNIPMTQRPMKFICASFTASTDADCTDVEVVLGCTDLSKH